MSVEIKKRIGLELRITETDPDYIKMVRNALDPDKTKVSSVLGIGFLSVLLVIPVYFMGVIIGFLPYVVLFFVEGRINYGENWVWDLVFGLIGLV